MDYNQEALEKLENVRVKRHEVKKKHPTRNLFIVVLIFSAIGYFLNSGFFDIKKISVEGNHYYNDNEVILMSGAKTGGNMFWGAGDSSIKEKLGRDPYFKRVSIKRKIPNELVVKVEERRQTAAFIYGEEFVVIDKGGIVLRKTTVDPKLTLIGGLKISRIKAGEPIEVVQKKTLNKSLEMLEIMKKGDLFFKRIELEEGEDKAIRAYIYDHLICKGKPARVIKFIENGDLQKVINNLLTKGTTRGSILVENDSFITFSPEIL